MAKFKKFVPPSFNEVKKFEEAKAWLSELERILIALKTDKEDMVSFAKFLLQGEASEWWKVEKINFNDTEPT